MNLPAYKEQLRLEILAIGKVNGMRKTCRDAKMSHDTWHRIRANKVAHVDTMEKLLARIKKACVESKA